MTDNPVSDAASDDALPAAAAAAAMRCSALRCRPGGRRHLRAAFIVSVCRLTSDTTNTTASRQFSALRAR